MQEYNFLTNLVLVDTGRLRTPKSLNPEGLTLRIFSNGVVYPSQELVDKFNLEYQPKDSAKPSNGFDFFDSQLWTPLATQPRMIIFGIVSKEEPKVDLFGTCRFATDGQPKSSVINQGTASPELLALVRSMGYLTEEQKYCDLELVVEYPIKPQDGIAYIPKLLERGEKAGELTSIRRENVTFYPVNTKENLKEMREANKNQVVVSTTNQVEINN
jgi:hypothetical protein